MTQTATASVPVVYVSGFGRSGSTIVEGLLQKRYAASGLGEIFFLWERGVLWNELCGCGAHFRECPFWSEVLKDGFGRVTEYDAQVYDAAFKKARGWIPRLASLREAERSTQLFREVAGTLYQAIGRKLGGEAIIDSSKYPLYGAWLTQTPGIDLSVLHLFRDPRAVSHSWSLTKSRPESVGDLDYMTVSKTPFSAVWRWKWFNHWSDELRDSFGLPSALVSYEKFCDDPETHLRAIGEALGLKPRTVPKDEWHSVSGNPVRFTSESLEIRKDERWREDMARASQIMTAMLCGAQHRRLRRAAAEFLKHASDLGPGTGEQAEDRRVIGGALPGHQPKADVP